MCVTTKESEAKSKGQSNDQKKAAEGVLAADGGLVRGELSNLCDEYWSGSTSGGGSGGDGQAQLNVRSRSWGPGLVPWLASWCFGCAAGAADPAGKARREHWREYPRTAEQGERQRLEIAKAAGGRKVVQRQSV